MPLVTIWRDPQIVDDETAVAIRDILLQAVARTLQVPEKNIEVRVRDTGRLDINTVPIGIEIDTGPGKDRHRINERRKLVSQIADHLFKTNILEHEWMGPDKSYVWIRIFESSFVPIGHPENAR